MGGGDIFQQIMKNVDIFILFKSLHPPTLSFYHIGIVLIIHNGYFFLVPDCINVRTEAPSLLPHSTHQTGLEVNCCVLTRAARVVVIGGLCFCQAAGRDGE